jgi:hypothetical protein
VIPPTRTISIADGKITYVRHVLADDGRRQLGLDNDVLTETVTVPLLVEPEGDVATWLLPRCSTCGR